MDEHNSNYGWLLMQLAEIEAIKAEISGMKAANFERYQKNEAIAYPESEFVKAAADIRAIAVSIAQNR